LYSIEDSYLPKQKFNPVQITSKNPLLTTEDSCIGNMAIDFTKLTSKLVLISRIHQLDKYSFYFNRKPLCNGLKLQPIRGFFATEAWGVWSKGDRTELTVETSEAYPRGGKLVFVVRPVINPNLANDQRIIWVDIDGKNKKSFSFASHDQTFIEMDFDKKDPGSIISVVINHINPIRFSDISGSDQRRVSLGFLSAKLISYGDNGQLQVESVTGAYDRESDGNNWWHWVERKVTFKLQPVSGLNDATQTKLAFEYGTRGKQTLTLRIIKRDGSSLEFLLQSKGDAPAMFERVIDLPPIELAEIIIETDGIPAALGGGDTRLAAWVIRNFSISPVFQ
jgi:hypothetical protein